MKRLFLLLLFAAPFAFPQACTNAGTGNVCSPGTLNTAALAKHGDGSAADGSWALLNHASDTGAGDLGCYYAGQVSAAYHNLQITLVNGTYSCGESDTSQGNQSYLTGAAVWKNLNYKPSEMPSGHVTIEVYAKMAKGWPAVWMLGGSGNTSGAVGCQYTTINQSWDNVGNCSWSQDSGGSDSGEVDIQENEESHGYTVASHNKFVNNTSDSCSQNISDSTQNFHLYHMDWSNSGVNMYTDGTFAGCGYTSNIPVNPMFLLIQNRAGSGAIPPSFPQTMVIQYVQVCDGTSCTAPDSTGGNTYYLDDFGSAGGTTGTTRLVGAAAVAGKAAVN